MIHTLTLNTAIDMNIFCDPLQPAAVNRTRQTEYCPNGKGVNVSLVLHHYQQPTHVMGIFGGFTGRYIVEELRKQHINVTPAWVAEPTRINIFINDGSDEYKLVNPGARIDDEGKEQILHHLQCVAPGDYLVISGSLPPGIESRFYSEILVLCQQKGCEVILDISHPVLRQLLEWRPLLIKPNDDELLDIIAIAESTPGPIAVNSATFVGYRVGGTAGIVDDILRLLARLLGSLFLFLLDLGVIFVGFFLLLFRRQRCKRTSYSYSVRFLRLSPDIQERLFIDHSFLKIFILGCKDNFFSLCKQ